MTPSTLGRYRIERELGRGSMGRVFLAYDPRMDRRVALKRIHLFGELPEAQAREARERFLREARAAGKLMHPGIVTVFDAGEEDGVAYLAMEYVEGPTLDRFTRPDALLPVPVVVELVAGVAETLDHAHRHGIVHRDIKPANLVRVAPTRAKIMDFGLAKDPRVGVTSDGAVLGTPAYMSPEQVRGEPLDGRSDLFSLGAVLYELLTGRRPFDGEHVSAVLYRVVHETPPRASELHPRVGRNLERFLERALAKEAEARWPDGRSFARALREAGARDVREAAPRGQGEPRGREPAAPASGGGGRRRSRGAFWAGVLAALAVLGGVAAYQTREHWWPSAIPAQPEWVELSVRAEPPDAELLYDGQPIAPGPLRLAAGGALGELVARKACRETRRPLRPEDAGQELVLVLDPVELEAEVDAGVPGAEVSLNGEAACRTPCVLRLDLCRDNRVEVRATGYEPAALALPAGIAPLEARSKLLALSLEPIPKGTLRLPPARRGVRFFVDGQPARAGEALELEAGTHRIRAVNDALWMDVTAEVEVPPGGDVTAPLSLPPVGTLVVQAFPPNCKVWLRRPGGAWVYLDTTPLRRPLAAGTYEVRIQFVPTGEVRERRVRVQGGEPAVVRESFVRSAR